MDLDSVAAELYAASPDEFVERRKLRADEARAAKDRPLVKAVGQLRRPTRSAWMVNLLTRESPDEVEKLLDLGVALGEAQRRASGPDLRRLSKDRQTTLDAMTRRASELAAAHGYQATETTRQEVSQTLQAALADSSVAVLVRTGRVTQPATYGGFGPVGLFAVPDLPESDSSEESAERADEEPASTASAEGPAVIRARAAVQAADTALSTARLRSTDAEQEADQATEQADELADRVEALRAQLSTAEDREGAARTSARNARKGHQVRQGQVTTAEQSLADAKEVLAALEAYPTPSGAAE